MGKLQDASIPTGNEFYVDDSLGLKEDSKLLGSSNRGWIKSITSIATPHDGSTLADIVTKLFPSYNTLLVLQG